MQGGIIRWRRTCSAAVFAAVLVSASPAIAEPDGGTTSDGTPAAPRVTFDGLVEAASRRLESSGSATEREAIVRELAENLAKERSITDDAIDGERRRLDRLLRDLHAGPVRVYPDPALMHRYLGIDAACARALELRRGTAPDGGVDKPSGGAQR